MYIHSKDRLINNHSRTGAVNHGGIYNVINNGVLNQTINYGFSIGLEPCGLKSANQSIHMGSYKVKTVLCYTKCSMIRAQTLSDLA